VSRGACHYRSYSNDVDKENVENGRNAGSFQCYDPPLPQTNVRLQQWEAHGLSYVNNSYDNGWNANEESAAGALLNFSDN
jgi:hypothetical protein